MILYRASFGWSPEKDGVVCVCSQVRSSAFPAVPVEAASSTSIEEVSQDELAAAKVLPKQADSVR